MIPVEHAECGTAVYEVQTMDDFRAIMKIDSGAFIKYPENWAEVIHDDYMRRECEIALLMMNLG